MINSQPKILIIGASGYIGSRLSYEFSKMNFDVYGCDVNAPSEHSWYKKFYQCRYQVLPLDTVRNIDLVLWFASHSSVKDAQADHWGGVENNVLDLLRFFKSLSELGLPVIYASSASVCSSADGKYSSVANETTYNVYDASKLAFDVLLSNCPDIKALGLRMATVCGWSPKMRWDTIFNSMNSSAYREGVVRVSNTSNFRSLLFIDDLFAFILMQVRKIAEFHNKPSVIPLSCWSGSIGAIAAEISDFWKVPIEFTGNNGTYSFVIPDTHMPPIFEGRLKDFYISIGGRCEGFANQHNWGK